ncbi:hypothetical protein EV681_3806 [Advenella incenata]|uniref:Uncharacterized protein n=1 Tax=Advenella incenata TaxID=267800 RepID=A0A4Q7V8K6_9BURK|nr:hypothetical protein EV681_3806 [Advenella incenata]
MIIARNRMAMQALGCILYSFLRKCCIWPTPIKKHATEVACLPAITRCLVRRSLAAADTGFCTYALGVVCSNIDCGTLALVGYRKEPDTSEGNDHGEQRW